MDRAVPADPSDTSATQETIAHLRSLLADYDRGATPPEGEPAESDTSPESDTASPGPPARQGRVPAGSSPALPQTHEEWVDHGREIALRQLGFAARSSQQLREAMISRDVPIAAAEEVLDRLTRVGLVDDAQYAAMLVRTRQAERGLSRRALRVELARKGIEGPVAELALDQVDEGDEAAAARDTVRKRVRTMAGLDPAKRRNRLYGTLARKGYSASAARAAIDEVLTEEGLELY